MAVLLDAVCDGLGDTSGGEGGGQSRLLYHHSTRVGTDPHSVLFLATRCSTGALCRAGRRPSGVVLPSCTRPETGAVW